MIKDYVKNTNMKGYAIVENILIFSKGYADLPKEAMEQYKKGVECQKGYFMGSKTRNYCATL